MIFFGITNTPIDFILVLPISLLNKSLNSSIDLSENLNFNYKRVESLFNSPKQESK